MVNPTLFDYIRKIAQKHAKEEDLGGNASTMALRAFLEGCRIKVGFPLNKHYFDKHFKSDHSRVEVIDGLRSIKDYHLSINYYRKDDMFDFRIPRSNRIFLNHDIANNAMDILEPFYRRMHTMDIIALGGTQLPNNFSHFVQTLVRLNGKLSLPEHIHRRVHLESSAFSNSTFYKTQLDILLPRIDSFGMNEREFMDFAQYMEVRKNLGTSYDAKSKYDESYLIRKMFHILHLIDEDDFRLNRISVHTINFHMVCFDRKIWRTGKLSIAKAILVSLQVAGNYTEENFHQIAEDLDLLQFSFPEKIHIFTTKGKMTITKEELVKQPVFSFMYDDKWKCAMGKTVEIKNPTRLRGLGDNISSASLLYQSLTKFDDPSEEVTKELKSTEQEIDL